MSDLHTRNIIEGWPGTYWIEKHNSFSSEELVAHLRSVSELLLEHSLPVKERLKLHTDKLKALGVSKNDKENNKEKERLENEIRSIQSILDKYEVPIALNRAYIHKIGL
jgi:hypothetical protein